MSTVNQNKKAPPVWQLTCDEVAARYKTDSVRGLSQKEAKKRLGRTQKQSLFVTTGNGIWTCIRLAGTDPVLWLLWAISILSLFFDRTFLGLSCLILALLNTVLCGLLEYRAELFDNSLEQADMPLCRVLRSGRVVRILPTEIVPGDVLLLRKGDLVPADARLIAGNDLRVSDPSSADKASSRMVQRSVSSDPILDSDRKNTLFHSNMINGGGVVIAGSGRAIVTSVGRSTHMGAMRGPVRPARHGVTPVGWKIIKENKTSWYVAMVICILPLAAIAIPVSSGQYGLLDIVLTALALAAVCIARPTVFCFHAIGAYMRSTTAKQRDTDNAASIKTAGVMESVHHMTDLVLVGSAALHDGILHPETVMCGNQSYTVGQSTPDSQTAEFSALLWLITQRFGTALTSGDSIQKTDVPTPAAVQAVMQWAEPDTTAWEIRILSAVPYKDGIRITYKNGTVQDAYLTEDSEIMYRSDTFRMGATETVPSDDQRRIAYSLYREAVLAGYHVTFLVSRQDGRTCMEGFLTLSYHGCRKAKGAIQDMEQAGIRVTAFVKDGPSPEVDRFFSECGFEIGKNAFCGATNQEILEFMHGLQHEGRRVGVLTVDHSDLSLLKQADVAFTCSPDGYAGNIPVQASAYDAESDGHPNSARATDLMRRRADVLIRRCTETGGGVCGVRNAVSCSFEYVRHIQRSLCYLLPVQLIRLLFVCFGMASLPSAVTVLLSGWLTDVLIVGIYAKNFRSHLKRTGTTLIRPDEPRINFVSYLPHLIVAVATTLVLWIGLWLIRGNFPNFLHTSIGQVCMFLVLTVAQIVLALVGYHAKARGGKD